MKYLDGQIIDATIPNHTLVPDGVLQKCILNNEKDKVLLKRACLVMFSGSLVLIVALIYFYRKHEKMEKENSEIKKYFETMVPLGSNITGKLNYNPDGKSTTAKVADEQPKVPSEIASQHGSDGRPARAPPAEDTKK